MIAQNVWLDLAVQREGEEERRGEGEKRNGKRGLEKKTGSTRSERNRKTRRVKVAFPQAIQQIMGAFKC